MNKCKFTEKQITFTLEQVENGASVRDVCNVMGISQATFYNWRNRYGINGSESSIELKRLKEENERLKSLIYELEKDKKILLEEVIKRR